ncbi:MAG: oligosaccharide flippase family protein [Terriglobia bacterium]
MNLKVHALTSMGTRWFKIGIHMILGFLLAPYILHRLGDYAFGLYFLILSLTGYYGLLDFGIRSSVVRYVARFHATGEQDSLNRFLSTAFFTYSLVACISVVITAVGVTYVDSIFHIAPGFLVSARILFLMCGAAIALSFPLGVFEGAMEGLQKFPSMDLIQLAKSLLRALLVVLALSNGLGLLTIALISVGLGVLVGVVYTIVVFRSIPLRISWKLVDRPSLKLMVNYSLPTFFIGLGDRLRSSLDATVIGIFMSSSAITYFSIGGKLVSYGNRFAGGMNDVFTPMSAHFDAAGNTEGLRKVLLHGTRACALMTFPISAMLILLGKPLIALWMGARYVQLSYPVLAVLAAGSALYTIQGPSFRILYGMARHAWLAYVRFAEGVTVLLLCIFLVHRFGILGVALGTAIPLTCSSLLFYPIHLCRLLKTSLVQYFTSAYLLPLGLCVPMIIAVAALRRLLPTLSYSTLAVQIAGGAAAYGIVFGWFFFTREPFGIQIRRRTTQYLRQASLR